MKRLLIAITMGDPAGIGPELTVKMLSNMKIYDICRPLVLGSKDIILDAIKFTHRALGVNVIIDPKDGKYEFGTIDLINFENVDMARHKYGKVSAMCGKAAGEYIEKAVKLAMSGQVDATVTNPIHKEAFMLGGWGKKYAGHTEMYADLTNTEKYSMMLSHGNFRVVHVSTHVSLAEACRRVKKESVLDVIRTAHNACKALGIEKPRIGVAGLNPHAGDGGLFGKEELEEIIPAISMAKNEGIDVLGPFPPDSIFPRAKGGFFDIVVAMYHDQGHIPMKFDGFNWSEANKSWKSVSGINVTLGLPIIRVSVDHGTAFGKAGKGVAKTDSIVEAIYMAVKLANSSNATRRKK